MTQVDDYAATLVDALGIRNGPLSCTQVARVHDDIMVCLRDRTLQCMATPAAMSTNARLLDGDHEVPRDRWTSSRMGHGQVIHTELHNHHIDEAVLAGQLFVVDSIEECDWTLLRFRESLEYILGARAWINAYLTAAGETSFGLHSDTHDTLIVQLVGTKVWHVDQRSRGVPDDLTVQDLPRHVLNVHDVLAMAGDTAHHVSGIGNVTLHLTIGFDRDIGLAPRLQEIEALLGRRSQPVALSERAHGMAMTPERRRGSSLPFRGTQDLADCDYVRWSSRLPPLVEHGSDGSITVLSAGQSHDYPPSLRRAVDYLTSGREASLRALQSKSGLQDEDLLRFLVRGVEAGTLIVRSGSDPLG